MRQKRDIRFANATVAAAVACFFALHALLGNVAAVAPLPRNLAWLVWAGVAAVAVHVVLSIVTSAQQLRDRTRPPSARKKRHLALKWATGVLLLAAACAHGLHMHAGEGAAPLATATGAALAAAAVALLAVHGYVGAKSLVTDLRVDRRHLRALRVGICIAGAALAGCALLALIAR